MAETLRERLYGGGRHRADELHVHRRTWWQSTGPLIGLLALLALGLFALWAYRRNQLPEVTIPKIEAPTLETPALPTLPDMPKAPDTPKADIPKLTDSPPPLPEPGMGPQAAPAVEPSREVCESATVFHFSTNATDLREADLVAVEKLAECLKSNPDKKVRLEGSADPRGADDLNRSLAIGRAQAVKNRLTTQGVPEAQTSIVVRAATCSEGTESCWQQDRSVTVVQQ